METLEERTLLSGDSIVVFNEIQFHPAGNNGALEWVEIYNQNTVNMDISGWRLNGAVNYKFPVGTVIGGGQYLVVAANPALLASTTGYASAMGPWTGQLANEGETLELLNNSDRLMDETEVWGLESNLADQPWTDEYWLGAVGTGLTLAKVNPGSSSGPVQNWRPSAQINGTPGAANFPTFEDVPVLSTPIDFGSTWTYYNNGDPGAGWADPNFVETGWSSGQGLFYGGDYVPPPPPPPVVVFSDDFTPDTVTASKWVTTNLGLESNGAAGYNNPSTTATQDSLTLGGTATLQPWYGKSLLSASTFSTTQQTTVIVDRRSLTGSGTAFRSSLWLFADSSHYLHFAQDVGELGWQFNANDVGGTGTLNAKGPGNDIAAFNTLDGDLGLHQMKLVFTPTGPGDGTIDIYLDNLLGASHSVTNWPASMRVVLTGQAKSIGDSVSAVFDNVSVAVPPAALEGGPESGDFAAPSTTSLSENFTADIINPAVWEAVAIGLESSGPAGYNAPTTTSPQDRLTLGGTANNQYWFGNSLRSVQTFSTDSMHTVTVDRVSLSGSGSAYRSSLWLYGDGGHYIHFSQNINEAGWTYNSNDAGGVGTLNPTGQGNNMALFDAKDASLGSHQMRIIFEPGATDGDGTIKLYLDGVLGATQPVTNWPSTFQIMMSGQARATNDTVSASFDNVNVTSILPGERKTELAMGQTASYFRTEFNYIGSPERTQLNLMPIADDGAVYYLNGVEVYRQNMAAGAVTHATLAASTIGSAGLPVAISLPTGALLQGRNVLAVELHQASAVDTDLLFGARLDMSVRPTPPGEAARIRLNEIAAASAPFFVEVVNEGDLTINLSTLRVQTDDGQSVNLPATMLAPGQRAAVNLPTLAASAGQILFLRQIADQAVLDAAFVEDRLRGRSDAHEGRWMYPNAATPGAANTFTFESDVVINEIMYHHRHTDPTPAVIESVTLLPIDAVWRYNQIPGGLPAGWASTTHPVDGVNWFSGPGLLAFDTTPAAIPGTILTNLTVSADRISYYFEREFEVTGDISGYALQIRHIVDDGAVFYINGQEVLRFNMPGGAIGPTTLATPSVADAASTGPVTIPSNMLLPGTNRISVQVHQSASTSSDIVFGLELLATRTISPEVPFLESNEEWVELYNRSGSAVDLSGWRFADAMDYQIPLGTTLGAGEYLVIARNAQALSAIYPGITILGNFSGSLSNSGERILLLDATGNLADEVHYYDGGPWDSAADGNGSSLELRDAHADNSSPAAWQASEESHASGWQTITYTGLATNTAGSTMYNEFILGLLDSGQVLIDDISVIEDPLGTARQLIQNGNFESGAATFWRIIGNHGGQVITDPTNPLNKVLRITATGATEHMHNHAETTLKSGASFVTINSGLNYQISFRAKWETGSNQLNSRLYFNRLQRTTLLDVPTENGTPGAANSRVVPNIGPTYTNFSHSPAIPSPGEAVTVTVNAVDDDPIASMTLFYAVNGGSFQSAPMNHLGDGRYQATIAGQSSGAIVQFYVQGVDQPGAVSTYPAGGQNSRALYKVNDGQTSPDAKREFRIIMTTADANNLHALTNVMSNGRIPGTVIYDNEVFYDIGVRLKGSERGRFTDVRVGFNIQFSPDHLFRGIHESVAIDRSGAGDQYSQKEILVKHIASRIGDLPQQYDDLIHVIAPRSQHSGSAMLGMARYGNVFLDGYFENGSDGTSFEYELVYYPLTTSVPGNPESLKVPSPDTVVGVSIADRGPDKENYRWNFLIENNRDEDDYSDLIRLAQTFSQTGATFQTQIQQNLDVDEWLRAYALVALTAIGDNYGTGAQHNMIIYTRPEDGKILYFPHDMDFSFTQGETSGVLNNGDLNKMLSGSPGNTHTYYGHLHDMIATTFNSAYMTTWVNHYDALLPAESFAGFNTFIANRAPFVSNLITSAIPSVGFAITTNGGNDQTVATNAIALSGSGWVNVREIRLAGESEPLPITWTANSTWQVTLPLDFGPNPFTLQAYDFQGNLIATDTITITSTSTTRPQYDFLRITEMNYHPTDPTPAELTAGFNDADLFEFIELGNFGNSPLALAGARFTNGISFNFTGAAVSTLQPGERVVVARNLAAYQFRYGASTPVAGAYTGALNNGGENITLIDDRGAEIHNFEYRDDGDWPGRADGDGSSLEVISVSGDYNDPDNWRSSGEYNGSPGVAGSPVTDVIINEVLTHTDDPQTDYVELYNTTALPIDISGWWISDSNSPYTKFQIPAGTILGAHAYMVFDESDFNPTPLTPGLNHFSFNGAHGDDGWLLRGMIGLGIPLSFADHVEFDAAFNGASLGRVPDGDPDADLFPTHQPTPGQANGDANVGPVVIGEVMYHPASPDNDLEYIEIYNSSLTTMNLSNWRFQGAVDFDFAPGTMIGGRSTLVILPFDPADPLEAAKVAAFEAAYGIVLDGRFIGPFSGNLDNKGERLKLMEIDDEPLDEPGYIPHPLHDAVRYDNPANWYPAADGLGESLHRYTPKDFPNAAAGWRSQGPTPGVSRGDTTADGVITAADIETLFANFGSSSASYDLDLSGNADEADVDLLVLQILCTFYGDADLNQQVSIGDLTILAENFGLSGGWAQGDFNGDGNISIGDLTRLAENFGQPSVALHAEDDGGATPAAAGLQALGDGDASSQDDEEDEDDGLIDILADLGKDLR